MLQEVKTSLLSVTSKDSWGSFLGQADVPVKVSVRNSVWSFYLLISFFTQPQKGEKKPCQRFLHNRGASVSGGENKVHAALISANIPGGEVFISVPENSLNEKTRHSGIHQRGRARQRKREKPITHLGGAFHEYHMKISVSSGESAVPAAVLTRRISPSSWARRWRWVGSFCLYLEKI